MRLNLSVLLATVVLINSCKKQEAKLSEAIQTNSTLDLQTTVTTKTIDDPAIIDLSDIELEPVYPVINEKISFLIPFII